MSFSRRLASLFRRNPAAADRRRSTPERRREQLRRQFQLETLESRQLMAADIFVAPDGHDLAGTGAMNAPFASIRRALDAAQPGDTITLRNGVYQGGLNIDIDNLTIRSYPGEWGVIESPVNDPDVKSSVIRYLNDVEGGRLENVEIVGGYWYGVKLEDWWDNPGPDAVRRGASGITITGCKIHDTGWDAVKIVPGANDITIENNEIYRAGRRLTQSADGIDNNNGDRMIARNNYIHDIPSIGILTTGGTIDSVIENNLVARTNGAGIVVGFYSELEWMEQDTNPELYTAINPIARNNIVVDAGQAGIGVYGAYQPQIYNNTLVNPATEAQAPIQFGGLDIWVSDTLPYQHVASVDPVVVNNIVTLSPGNDSRMVDIRQGSYVGQLTLDGNLYHTDSVTGHLFIDRNVLGDSAHEQTLSQWRAQGGYDLNSLLADPLLDATFHATAGSPSIDAGLNSPAAVEDFDGNARVDGLIDIGADEFGAGVNRATPPAAFGAPSIEITARAAHAEEGQSIVLTVRRDGTTSDTVSVDYQTIDGGATAGVDYTPVAGTLVFAPGETEKTIVVPLSQDSIVEGNEHVLLKLSNPTTNGALPARLGWQSAATLVIDDDEAPQPINYRTLWVSNDGSDVTGDGSEASPWKSLQYAADQVGPGDYVIVKPGQYWGFQVTTDGKADAPITFHAEPGVLIDAPNPENNLDGINLEGADYVTIENFTVNDMPRTGIRSVMNTNAIIRGNTLDHNGMWGVLTGWSYNLLVEGNSVSRSVGEHGIYVSNSSDDGIVRNNLVWGNHDSGIQFNADGFLEGDGVHSRNIVEGNVLFGNGKGGGATINLDGFQDGIVRNNLLYENHSTGIVLYVGFAAEPSTNNVVANNTVVMASDARWALLLENASSGNTIVNNILLNKNPNRGSITADDSSRVGLISDHNIVVDRFTANGWQTIDFAHWKAISGQDANSVLSTPEDVFIDPAAGDYRLKTSSPALDAADPQFAPAVDVYQHARPYGAGPDIGALEAGQFVSQVQFDWSNYVGYEDGGMAVLTVVRSGDTSMPVSVEFTTADGTAVAGADYSSTSGVIEFRAGETTKTLVVMIANDDEIEPVEQLTVSLVNPVGTQLGGNSTAGLHIVSDDQWTPGQLQFSVEYQTVGEGDVVAVVTVVRTGGTSGQVAVDYSTVAFTPPAPLNYSPRHTWNPKPTDDDDPATAGLDYQGVAGTLVFDDGVATQSFVVPVSDDLWYEKDEAFGLRLSNPTNGATLGKRSAAWVEILNDDAKQPGRFQFSSPTYTVFEGQLAAMLTVVRVDGDNVPASVRLYNAGGDGNGGAAAWAPSDHGWAPEQLDFAAGESTKTVMIPIVDDSMVEDDEFFRLQLYSPTNDATIGDPATAVVRIRDNDSAFEWAQEGKFSASEGDGVMNVTIRRKGSSVGQAWVSFATYDGTATAGGDYASTQQTLLFGDGVTSRTVSISVVNDSVKEADETFGIHLLDPINASLGSYVWGGATILNDDIAAVPGSLTLSGSTYQVNENGGSLLVTVERTDGSDGTVSVDYSTSDGATGFGWSQTAYAGGDYTSTKGKLTFGPGETVKTFSVPITNDSSVEQNEVFTIKLSNAQGGATLGAVTKAVATIIEDDSSISYQTPGGSGSYTVKEDAGSAAVTLFRKGGTAAAASITLKTYEWGSAKSGVDFTPVNVVVTFAPGETTKTVAVPIVNDSLAEGQESFGVSLSNPVGTTQASWSATVNIQDDDTAPQPGVFQFQYSTFSTQENWGYAVIYVTRTGGSSGAVSVNYSTSPGTATPGVDYAPVSGTLNFADGETTKTFNISLYDDLLNEVDEDVLLALSSPTGGATLGAQDHALLKIISNE